MIEAKPADRAWCDIDLRRAPPREASRELLERAAWLPAADRALIEACFGEGLSVAAYVRRLRDRGDRTRSTQMTRRHLRRLIARLGSGRFAFVVDRRAGWPPTRRRVAMAAVVQGRSMRETASSLGLSLHAVRRHLDAVEALYAAERDVRRAAARSLRAASRSLRATGGGEA